MRIEYPREELVRVAQVSRMPGACQVVLVRAGYLTDAHVIRLGHGQGTWPSRTWCCHAGGQAFEVRHAWREVLDVFPDRDSLEAQFGEWQRPAV